MKRLGHAYEEVALRGNLSLAIQNASRRKKNRKMVERVLADVEMYVDKLCDMFADEEFELHPYKVKVQWDPSCQKMRTIHKPDFWPDQCLHWAIYNILEPYFRNSMYEYSVGSIPGRGNSYGRKAVERWVQRDHNNTKYYLKMDIRHFYESIPNDLMKEFLRTKIKDKKLLRLIDQIIDMDKGLPIGMVLSQLFGNMYLTPLDFYIKQELGAIHYIRNMDDMVIFGPNKKKLHKMRKQIQQWLDDHGLELKSNWQVYKEDAEPLDFLGFRFYREKVIIRKRTLYRSTKKINKIIKKFEADKLITQHEAASLISRLGMFKAADVKKLKERLITDRISVKELKAIAKGEISYEADEICIE